MCNPANIGRINWVFFPSIVAMGTVCTHHDEWLIHCNLLTNKCFASRTSQHRKIKSVRPKMPKGIFWTIPLHSLLLFPVLTLFLYRDSSFASFFYSFVFCVLQLLSFKSQSITAIESKVDENNKLTDIETCWCTLQFRLSHWNFYTFGRFPHLL